MGGQGPRRGAQGTGECPGRPTVPLLPSHHRARLWWLMIPLPFLVATLHPRVQWAMLRRGPRLQLVDGQPVPPVVSTMSKATGWSLAGWACYGPHFASLALAFHTSDPKTLVLVCTSGFALAWCAGLVVFLLPAGIGTRDLALVGALIAVVPAGPALAVAVTSRVVATACDLGCAGTAFATSRVPLRLLTAERISPPTLSPAVDLLFPGSPHDLVGKQARA